MTKKQIYLTLIFGIILSIGLYDFLPSLKNNNDFADTMLIYSQYKRDSIKKDNFSQFTVYDGKKENTIKKLTEEKLVIDYIKKYHKLPDYYITKSEARKYGWNPSKGNLCETLPNKAIGGDKFGNRENKLPKGDYYEADINYNCGRRNSDRVIFNKKGDVWVTKNHYKTFEKR